MSSNIEGPSLSFRKHTGKETTVKIIGKTRIDKGSFGEIFDTFVEINGHRKRFIIKKYFDDPREKDKPSAKIDAKLAFENYSLAKKAGLRVFPTFRIGDDEKSILMTTGFLDDRICVGSNNPLKVVDLQRPLVEKIKNIDEFLSTFFAEGLKAAQKGIYINWDVPFFILSKDEPTKIDFVLGDLDHLRKQEESKKETGLKNMVNIRKVLIKFCKDNINHNLTQNFLDRVEHHYIINRALKML